MTRSSSPAPLTFGVTDDPRLQAPAAAEDARAEAADMRALANDTDCEQCARLAGRVADSADFDRSRIHSEAAVRVWAAGMREVQYQRAIARRAVRDAACAVDAIERAIASMPEPSPHALHESSDARSRDYSSVVFHGEQ